MLNWSSIFIPITSIQSLRNKTPQRLTVGSHNWSSIKGITEFILLTIRIPWTAPFLNISRDEKLISWSDSLLHCCTTAVVGIALPKRKITVSPRCGSKSSSVHAKKFQLCPTLCDPIETVALQAPLSLGFSRQEYWSGLLFPPPRDLPNLGIQWTSLVSRALAGGFSDILFNPMNPKIPFLWNQ